MRAAFIALALALVACGGSEPAPLPSDPPPLPKCGVCPTLDRPTLGGACVDGSRCPYISTCGGLETFACAGGAWTLAGRTCAADGG